MILQSPNLRQFSWYSFVFVLTGRATGDIRLLRIYLKTHFIYIFGTLTPTVGKRILPIRGGLQKFGPLRQTLMTDHIFGA